MFCFSRVEQPAFTLSATEYDSVLFFSFFLIALAFNFFRSSPGFYLFRNLDNLVPSNETDSSFPPPLPTLHFPKALDTFAAREHGHDGECNAPVTPGTVEPVSGTKNLGP